MKKVELLFGAILVPLDYLMVLLAGWLAYRIRFTPSITGIRDIVYPLPFNEFFLGLLLYGVVLLVIFAWNGLYDITGTRRIVDEIRKVFLACSTGVVFILIMLFFYRELFSSRFIILSTWTLSIVFISAMRFTVIQIERWLLGHGIGIHQILLIGDNRIAQMLSTAIAQSPTLGFRVVERTKHVDENLFVKLEKIIRLKQIDEIISTDPELNRWQASRLIEFCTLHHLQFKYAADLFDAQLTNITIRPLAGVPIVEVHNTPLQGWGKIIKRLLDMFFALIFIIIFGPLMLAVALAVRLESPGPIIYRNRRVGERGREFDTYKFRSMYQRYCIGDQFDNTSEALQFEQKLITERSIKTGPLYKIKDDPRVTRVGALIRRLSFDELPQFFNVFKGDMSIVGPRPHQPREVEQYAKHHRAIFNMKPGITGLAQIFGRSDLEFEEEAKLDTYYMENWNIWLDAYIAFKTPFAMLKKRQAL